MQESFSYLVGILMALGVTVMVAFPELVSPDFSGKKKRYSGRHWGAYKDSPDIDVKDDDKHQTIEVGLPAKKSPNVTGSRTYASGK